MAFEARNPTSKEFGIFGFHFPTGRYAKLPPKLHLFFSSQSEIRGLIPHLSPQFYFLMRGNIFIMI